MAVSQQESQANIKSLTAQGVPESSITNYGNKLNPNEAAAILAAFKATGDPYSSNNIASVSTAPTARPDMSDPMALRQFYLDQLGVGATQTELQDITNRINAFDTQTDTTLNAIENKPIRLGVITGEQAATERSRATTRSSLAREQLAKQSFLDAARQEADTRFNIANTEREKLQQMIIQSGGNAGISYADTVAEAAKKLSKYEKKVKEEEDKAARKQAEKDALKSAALAVGISTKGLSSNEIRKKLEKRAKKDQAAKDAMDELDRKIKQKSLNSTSSSDSDYEKKKDQLYKDVTDFQNRMAEGKANWATAFSTITSKYGLNADEVDSLLGISYRNAYDKPLK